MKKGEIIKSKILISAGVVVAVGVLIVYAISTKKDTVSVVPALETETTISLKNSPERVTKFAPEEKSFFADMTDGEIRYVTYDQTEYIRIDKNGKELGRKKINFEPYIYAMIINNNGTKALIKAVPDANIPNSDAKIDNRLYNWYYLDLQNGSVVKYPSDIHAVAWKDNDKITVATNNENGTELFISPANDLSIKEMSMIVSEPINVLIKHPTNSRFMYAYGASSEEERGILYAIDLAEKKARTIIDDQLDIPLISPKGTYALSSKKDDILTVVRLDNKSDILTIKTTITPGEAVFSADEKTIALPVIENNASPSIVLYDIEKQKYIKKITTDDLAVIKLVSLTSSTLVATVNDSLSIIKL